tara:strand:- start:201 stop:416 length:216 start_codon:yes stop_codon:yes gene_type:complete
MAENKGINTGEMFRRLMNKEGERAEYRKRPDQFIRDVVEYAIERKGIAEKNRDNFENLYRKIGDGMCSRFP